MGDSNYATSQQPGSGYNTVTNPASPYGSPPAKPSRSKLDYVTDAITQVGWVKGTGYPDIFDMNRRITAQYRKMYLRKKGQFKWAGMAALASAKVGEGLSAAWNGIAAMRYGILAPAVAGIPDFTDVDPNKLFTFLAEGNRMVYTDIYWQHVCYLDGGIDFIASFYHSGDLTSEAYQGWYLIDQGVKKNNMAGIWDGNTVLLKYEQQQVLQHYIYDADKEFWKRVTQNKLSPIDSPVPGGKSFQAYVPGGNIGEFADRWKWITEDMLPAWQSFDAKGG
ncbi:MAG TPA: hypothetical protein VG870_01105 [Chitinophagaceae bacterium]|nr:hypothetical protein [Chitinophagaceae bacterium]